MLATYLFSKSTKAQIILPFPRLNIKFDVIRCNSSSDDDSNTPSSNKINNEKLIRPKTENCLRYINKNKKSEIYKILNATANVLTTKPEIDKQKVMSNLLNNINTIQNLRDKVPNEQKKFTQKNIQNRYQNKVQDIENEFKKEPRISKIPSMIRTLKYEKTKNQEKQKQNFETSSVIQTLLDNKRIIQTKLIKKQYERKSETNFSNNKENYEVRKQLNANNNSIKNLIRNWQNTFIDEHDKFKEAYSAPEFKIWDEMEKSKLQFITHSFGTNAFEEMIEWTKEGKLWKFPIDNEQGMEKEQNVHFSKHVFLEHHLTSWCPTKGPIRHFMELICIGLSKNPYMTFQEKYDHITWYKNYFQDKHDLLQNLEAIE